MNITVCIADREPTDAEQAQLSYALRTAYEALGWPQQEDADV